MAASTDLYDLAAEYLDACYDALADTPGGQPECVYVSEGPPSWDVCPCLCVHVGGPDLAPTLPLSPALAPMFRVAVQGEVNMISLTATVLRCATVLDEQGNLPTPTAHSQAALDSLSDLWAIWNHVRQRVKDGTLFPPPHPGSRREFGFDPAIALNPAGGCCGWQIGVRVRLDGYVPNPA